MSSSLSDPSALRSRVGSWMMLQWRDGRGADSYVIGKLDSVHQVGGDSWGVNSLGERLLPTRDELDFHGRHSTKHLWGAGTCGGILTKASPGFAGLVAACELGTGHLVFQAAGLETPKWPVDPRYFNAQDIETLRLAAGG